MFFLFFRVLFLGVCKVLAEKLQGFGFELWAEVSVLGPTP